MMLKNQFLKYSVLAIGQFPFLIKIINASNFVLQKSIIAIHLRNKDYFAMCEKKAKWFRNYNLIYYDSI